MSAASRPKPVTEATKAANEAVLKSLPFGNKSDFEDAGRGLIARPEHLTIKNDKGDVVWDLEQYKTYIGDDKPAPDTVNPSLWRNATQLNMHYGLFKVTDRIYQVRGYDLSNITFIQGDTGWIVLDPLISAETAKAGQASQGILAGARSRCRTLRDGARQHQAAASSPEIRRHAACRPLHLLSSHRSRRRVRRGRPAPAERGVVRQPEPARKYAELHGNPDDPLGKDNYFATLEGMTSLLEGCSYAIVASIADGDPIVIGAKTISPAN